MYQQITSNRRKSRLLIALFIGVLALAGYAFGTINGDSYGGLILALLISVGMTLVSFFVGDKIVLSSTGAKKIDTREQYPYVWNMVENLCLSTGMKMPAIYIIQDPSPNAFATGRNEKTASIALTTGIIELLENEELEGVIAHELSHIKNEDVKLMLYVAVLVGSLTLMGDWFLRGSLFRGRGRDSDRGSVGGILFIVGIVFLILSPLIGELIKLAISRKREFLADASGSLMTRYPDGLASALEKIQQANIPMERASRATAHLWISSPFGAEKVRSWFSTHPPVEERVKALREMGR